MKSTDIIGIAIVAMVLITEYFIARRVILPNWFFKILLSVLLPIGVLIAICALQPMLYTLGRAGVICILSIPLLLCAIPVKARVLAVIKVMHTGDVMSFTGKVYGSVGYQYRVEFDKSAFSEEIQSKELYKPRLSDYHKDEKTGEMIFRRPCGSDKMDVTHILTAKRKGMYEIVEIVEFRGDVESQKVHRVLVK